MHNRPVRGAGAETDGVKVPQETEMGLCNPGNEKKMLKKQASLYRRKQHSAGLGELG